MLWFKIVLPSCRPSRAAEPVYLLIASIRSLAFAKAIFASSSDLIDPETASVKLDASRDDLAAIQSIKVKSFGEDGLEHEVKLADKLRALDLLGKHLGMYKDASEKENAAAQNNDMQTLADLLQRPVPNRDIKDFEE